MKIKLLPRVFLLSILLVSFLPDGGVVALSAAPVPPVDMFQLPWDQGIAWVAIDGIDNGRKRPLSSSHNYSVGGAIDFAPHNNMIKGEDTSNYWVTAAAAGTVVGISSCHIILAHDSGWITQYQFLANVQVGLGDGVDRNQRLGIIADGVRYKFCPGSLEPNVPHLHFMLRPSLIGATFAGWEVKYSSFWNTTSFSKNGTTVGLYRPLLNVFDQTLPTSTPDPSQATATPYGQFTNTPDVQATLTAIAQPTHTPDPSQLTATADTSATLTAIAQPTNTPDPSQATATPGEQITNTPDVQATLTAIVQPTNTTDPSQLTPTPTQSGPYVTTTVDPVNVMVNGTTLASVSLHNVPSEGYASAEFTCTSDPALVSTDNISVTNLFGADPATVANFPQAGIFIVAIAGSHGSRAHSGGVAFTFNLTALQTGQAAINCDARISSGDNILTSLPSFGAVLTILNNLPSPTSTSPADGWLTFTNLAYGFEFKYPPQGVIADGRTDTFARLDLPFVQGTNLREKYLEVIVVENANPCQSPLATESILETSEMVTISGIPFLKQTGGDGGAGNLHQWVAYSTIMGNACVSLDFILHSLNPGNFSTPPPVFDYGAESAVFGEIASTYLWLTSLPTATPTSSINGLLAGQAYAVKPVTIILYASDNSIVASVASDTDGTFTLAAPAGTYTAVASSDGFLKAQATVTLISGSTTTLMAINLPAGDIDGNNIIDQFDAMSIGMNYNTAEPSIADLNDDSIINVLDLELLAANYRKSGPVHWQ